MCFSSLLQFHRWIWCVYLSVSFITQMSSQHIRHLIVSQEWIQYAWIIKYQKHHAEQIIRKRKIQNFCRLNYLWGPLLTSALSNRKCHNNEVFISKIIFIRFVKFNKTQKYCSLEMTVWVVNVVFVAIFVHWK